MNSPRDWSTPTIEKARPVKMMVGKRVRRSPVQSARAASENPPAWKDARGPAKTIPAAARAVVSRAMRVVKLLAKRNASSLPSFSRYSLNTGMKLAEMAENKDQDRVNKLSFQTYTLEERLARVKKMLEDT